MNYSMYPDPPKQDLIEFVLKAARDFSAIGPHDSSWDSRRAHSKAFFASVRRGVKKRRK